MKKSRTGERRHVIFQQCIVDRTYMKNLANSHPCAEVPQTIQPSVSTHFRLQSDPRSRGLQIDITLEEKH